MELDEKMKQILDEVLEVADECEANKKIADTYMKKHPYFLDKIGEHKSTKILRYLYRVYDHKGTNYYGTYDYKMLAEFFDKQIGTLSWYIYHKKLYKGEWLIEQFENPLY